jgi:glycosyltransferase involved in cell wall biosynthesis
MKVNVITPSTGGPYTWGKNLTEVLNTQKNTKGISASHICNLKFSNLLIRSGYENADVIHTTTKHCILCKKPVILTIHGDYKIEQSFLKSNYALYELARKRADIITVPSQYLKERLCLDDAIVIPNAIQVHDYPEIEHQPKNELNIVTMTNLNFKEKADGIIDLLELICVICRSTSERINFTVIGGGKYFERVKESHHHHRVQENLTVNFSGFVPDPKPLLLKSDIFIYCSYLDNFPNVILEAMAVGLPVITNRIGAVDEMIRSGHDGFVVNDCEDYTNVLQNLMQDHTLREAVGGSARLKVKKMFSWDKVVEEYVALYRSLH